LISGLKSLPTLVEVLAPEQARLTAGTPMYSGADLVAEWERVEHERVQQQPGRAADPLRRRHELVADDRAVAVGDRPPHDRGTELRPHPAAP
jgi:hypothetical protein